MKEDSCILVGRLKRSEFVEGMDGKKGMSRVLSVDVSTSRIEGGVRL